MPIAELAARLGVTLRTLRFYEHKKLLRSLIVSKARHYDQEACLLAAEIVRLRSLGFTLAEIRLLLPAQASAGDAAVMRDAIARQIAELERRREAISRALEELHGLTA